MNREVPFSSKRMLLALTLCACAVILLQNHELSQRLSFPLTLGAMAAGLAACFVFFIPSMLLKSRYNTDALTLLQNSAKPVRLLTAAVCGAALLYIAVYFLLPYTEIPVHFPGTGDMFSAILIGHLMNGVPLKQATRRAMDSLSKLIEANKDNSDKNRGIPVEHFLNLI